MLEYTKSRPKAPLSRFLHHGAPKPWLSFWTSFHFFFALKVVTKIISFCPNFSINYVSGRPFLMLPQNLGYVINLILNCPHFLSQAL